MFVLIDPDGSLLRCLDNLYGAADQPTRLAGRLSGVHPIGGGLTIPPKASTPRSRFGNVTMPRDVMTLSGR
jgi:hypothetical protein